MAKTDAVWGIDIGQCALKALRCRPHEDPSKITADAFDYIEYPKILSQPDVDPAELVRDALKQFLSRNSVRGDRVVISVSGQSGLARFIKLPPVEAKRIPDIVKYEARQQIPFSLEDVVWDYQTMVGGSVVEGFAMETEVGLFAMKRDQVYRALKPFTEAGIEADIVQLTPLALYNFVAFDQMENLPPPEEYDPESPPESVILISLGTDTTDLVVTNGFRVWQRNIPIGGNHFTKALTKELKLTFASAEHLKRNATQAEDPKALFQAMRPVFNDLLTEVQRSISFFSNLDRRAKISRAVALGNAMKLPGLQRYLAQNLGFDLVRLETFRGLAGSAVVDAPAFKENVPAFGVCYGLTLQALRETRIKTNLLPREIAQDRMIRDKRPWAVGAAAALLLGCGVSYLMHWVAANSVAMEGKWDSQVKLATSVVGKVEGYRTDFKGAKDKYSKTTLIGDGFIQNVVGRDIWLKIMKGVNLCLPHDPPTVERPKDITQRNEINIERITCKYVDDLGANWYDAIKSYDKPLADLMGSQGAAAVGLPAPPGDAAAANGAAAANPAGPNGAAPANPGATSAPAAAAGTAPPANGAAPAPAGDATAAQAAAAPVEPPKGPGWVFELKGYHFHNARNNPSDLGAAFVARTLLKNLREADRPLPVEERFPGGPTAFPLKKLGIGHSILITTENVNWQNQIEVDDYEDDSKTDDKKSADKKGKPAAGRPAGPGAADRGRVKIDAPRYDFVIQFCWQVPPPSTMVELAQLYPSAGAPGNGAAAAAGALIPGTEMPPADETADADGSETEMEADEVEGGPGAATPDQPATADTKEEK
ncbi:MAG TPA: type IV pilus assembly protein PilM [Pirellulales bacterium]|nr:type IV pilus assembly protein PilM [Pirellulales bacterium]